MANNIQINYYNGSAYTVLYPQTLGSLVNGAVSNATNADNASKLGGYTYNQVVSNASGEYKIKMGGYTGTNAFSSQSSIYERWHDIEFGVDYSIFLIFNNNYKNTFDVQYNEETTVQQQNPRNDGLLLCTKNSTKSGISFMATTSYYKVGYDISYIFNSTNIRIKTNATQSSGDSRYLWSGISRIDLELNSNQVYYAWIALY